MLTANMPLFSSKFAFKKSPQRRRNSPEEKKVKEEEEDDISSAESEHEDGDQNLVDEEENSSKDRPKSADKRSNKSKRSQSSASIVSSTKASKLKSETKYEKKKDPSKETPKVDKRKSPANSKQKASRNKGSRRNQLVLSLDQPQGACFQFDVKQGVWKECSLESGTVSKSVDLQMGTGQDSESTVLNSELLELSSKIKALQEENRLLKLKIEILMEMVTETTAELNLKDKHER